MEEKRKVVMISEIEGSLPQGSGSTLLPFDKFEEFHRSLKAVALIKLKAKDMGRDAANHWETDRGDYDGLDPSFKRSLHFI